MVLVVYLEVFTTVLGKIHESWSHGIDKLNRRSDFIESAGVWGMFKKNSQNFGSKVALGLRLTQPHALHSILKKARQDYSLLSPSRHQGLKYPSSEDGDLLYSNPMLHLKNDSPPPKHLNVSNWLTKKLQFFPHLYLYDVPGIQIEIQQQKTVCFHVNFHKVNVIKIYTEQIYFFSVDYNIMIFFVLTEMEN